MKGDLHGTSPEEEEGIEKKITKWLKDFFAYNVTSQGYQILLEKSQTATIIVNLNDDMFAGIAKELKKDLSFKRVMEFPKFTSRWTKQDPASRNRDGRFLITQAFESVDERGTIGLVFILTRALGMEIESKSQETKETFKPLFDQLKLTSVVYLENKKAEHERSVGFGTQKVKGKVIDYAWRAFAEAEALALEQTLGYRGHSNMASYVTPAPAKEVLNDEEDEDLPRTPTNQSASKRKREDTAGAHTSTNQTTFGSGSGLGGIGEMEASLVGVGKRMVGKLLENSDNIVRADVDPLPTVYIVDLALGIRDKYTSLLQEKDQELKDKDVQIQQLQTQIAQGGVFDPTRAYNLIDTIKSQISKFESGIGQSRINITDQVLTIAGPLVSYVRYLIYHA